MTVLHRRDQILDRIEARCRIEDTGFILDHKPSPCHLWTGPDSGTGRGGGYGRMSLDGQMVTPSKNQKLKYKRLTTTSM